ncbi:MAG: P-loop NTPase [Acidimicrobiia bacterium]|nr:P-loop NTPase [Acidimicrobiia bacterium]
MELSDFCSTSRVFVVAGKGGVGKTTVTAALAVAAAGAGLSVLIIEVEGKSGLASMFDRPALTYDEGSLGEGIAARTLTPDAALIDYLVSHGLKRISKRLVSSGALDIVATAVPGMRDILVLGKVKSLEESRAADVIILDAPAAGHAVSFLLSPRGILDAVRVGPVRKQASDVVDLLSDPRRCQVLLVTIPEETPVNELVDTAYTIEDRVGVALGPVIVNGCYEPLLGGATTDAASVSADAATIDRFVSERETGDMVRAAAFREERHSLQLEQAERLSQMLPLPQIQLPFLFESEIHRPQVDVLAAALAAGIATLAPPS